MKSSTTKKRDTASNRSDTRMTRMKNRLKIIATSALLLAATNVMAGIISLPGSNTYTAPELAQMSVSKCPGDFNVVGGCVRIQTTGLAGELTIQGSDFPPEYNIATTEKVVLPFDQGLELVIDIAEGTVSGRSTANFLDMASGKLDVTAAVSGSASCLPLNGRECGQLVVDLELRGVLSDPNDPSIVGQLQMEMLGSMIWDGQTGGGIWAGMSSNAMIGGNEGLINSLTRMGDANLDG